MQPKSSFCGNQATLFNLSALEQEKNHKSNEGGKKRLKKTLNLFLENLILGRPNKKTFDLFKKKLMRATKQQAKKHSLKNINMTHIYVTKSSRGKLVLRIPGTRYLKLLSSRN